MTNSLRDTSLWVLIFSNVASIVLALTQNWSMSEIVWVYWGQSVTIGVINVIRMLNLKEFSTKNMTSNGKRPPENDAFKKSMASFFAFHYGFFHLGYFLFLWQMQPISDLNLNELLFLMMLIFAFLGSHGFSYQHNKTKDFKDKKPNIGVLLFYPYMRIVPMHAIIIFGGILNSSAAGILIFMTLKTLADAGMHVVEHRLFQKKT